MTRCGLCDEVLHHVMCHIYMLYTCIRKDNRLISGLDSEFLQQADVLNCALLKGSCSKCLKMFLGANHFEASPCSECCKTSQPPMVWLFTLLYIVTCTSISFPCMK